MLRLPEADLPVERYMFGLDSPWIQSDLKVRSWGDHSRPSTFHKILFRPGAHHLFGKSRRAYHAKVAVADFRVGICSGRHAMVLRAQDRCALASRNSCPSSDQSEPSMDYADQDLAGRSLNLFINWKAISRSTSSSPATCWRSRTADYLRSEILRGDNLAASKLHACNGRSKAMQYRHYEDRYFSLAQCRNHYQSLIHRRNPNVEKLGES